MTDHPCMLLRPTALALLHRLQHGLSNPPAELIHVPHTLWPLPAQWQHHAKSKPLRISVLDASFNPPTLAHLALLNAPRPNLRNFSREGDYEDEDEDGGEGLRNNYDATLLLLSVRNADKALKPSDATYLQRLEMMDLLAQHIHPADPRNPANVAIAIIDEPTFVGKSSCLLQFLNRRLATATTPALAAADSVHLQLHFILGIDTLERLVAPRYYPSESAMLTSLRRFLSPSADDSIVVCARRKSSSSIPLDVGNRLALAEEFLKSERIVMIDIGDEESTYSSTAVRTAIQQLGLGEEAQNQWKRFVPASVADYIVHEKLYVSPT